MLSDTHGTVEQLESWKNKWWILEHACLYAAYGVYYVVLQCLLLVIKVFLKIFSP